MKKYHRFKNIFIPFVGFLLILLMMNGYQYLKVKNDFTAGMIREIGDVEARDLKLFFSEIEEKLLLIRDWGENDLLLSDDIVGLNKKLIPILERLPYLSGIVFATVSGQEYFLYREGVNYITRSTMPGSSLNHYSAWSVKVDKLKSWKKDEIYDPRKRPWFIETAGDSEVHWTGVYTFFNNKKQGITASVSWGKGGETDKRFVLGIDISLARIEKILAAREAERPGILFLVKNDGSFLSANNLSELPSDGKGNRVILTRLVEKWQEIGNPPQELIRVGMGKDQWLASFQKIDHSSGSFWVGLAAPKNELVGWLDQTLFNVDLVELAIAVGGSAIIVLLMWKFGALGKKPQILESPELRFFKYLAMGEGAEVEFKSTIRTNLKSGKVGKEIEFAWLKGVVAFLNSSGGTLLIGVDDSGKVCGVEIDGFESSDRTLLHIKNLLNQHIGAEFSAFFNATLISSEEKQVAMVECLPAGEAVFLKIGKNEEFYIRSGPSSVKLSPSQMVSYVQQNKKL